MSLTASLWTSVSGLLAHGEKMNVIGNNISNVNTVGFKGQRMDFQDFVYQYVGTANGMGQVGRGTSIGAIMNDFSQGSAETTTNSTDISIEGNGFFKVKPKNNNMNYYTRAGNFRFDKDGFLVDPHGYVLQGWGIDRDQANAAGTNRQNTKGIVGSGSPVDIKLDSFTCPPRHTTNITTPLNLDNKTDKASDDKSTDAVDPFFALLKNWDATQDIPLGSNMRAHQTTMEVYDEAGKMHKLTIYFDRVVNGNGKQNIDGNSIGEDYWEFIVTMDPSEDVRDFASEWDPTGTSPTNPNVPEKLKGLLGAGTLTFDSTGTMKDMSFFVPQSDPTVNNGAWWDADGNVNLDSFVASPISTNGYPMFAPNFAGTAGLQTAYGYNADGSMNTEYPNINAQGRMIALDFGMRSTATEWHFLGDPDGNMPDTYVDRLGNNTGLPTAGSLSSFVPDRPVQDSKGNFIWEATSGGTTYEVSAPEGVTPSGNWTAATPAHNATKYHWTVSVPDGVLTSSGNIDTSTNVNPGTTFNPASIPNNIIADQYEAGGYTMNVGRNGGQGGTTRTPADITDWTLQSTDGTNNVWVSASDPNTTVTLLNSIPGLSSTDDPNAAGTGINDALGWTAVPNGEVAAGGGAIEYYWTANAGGNTVTATTTGTTPPTLTCAEAGNNASKYYFVDPANHNVKLTLDAADPNDPPPTVPPGLTWTQKTESVYVSNKYFANGMDGQKELLDPKITSYEGGFYEHNGFKQDGYTYGDLRYVTVSTDGVLSGSYSNGVTLQLYQITLHDFPSTQNLRREGGNLFSETRESGVPSSGAAGTGTYGTTHGNSLEQSNVDLSREFVNMITTQRGFQANSKSITTVDTMLETVIMMKR